MNRPKAVGFDWDNTLVDTFALIVESNNKVRSTFGLPEWTAEDVRLNSSGALRETYPKLYGDKWELARDIYYDHYYSLNKTRLKPLSGAADLLQQLHAEKVPLFIVSTKRGEILRDEIKALGWEIYFSAAVGSADTTKDKPDSAAFEAALIPLGFALNDLGIWYVGDTEVDVKTARNAGCTSLIIGPQERVNQWGADKTFSDCQELMNLLYNK